MKLLFLRGQVPTDRDPKQIMFNSLEESDDMWISLAFELCKENEGQLWYWGGTRKVHYANNFIERWISNFKISRYDFDPEVIFCRGGFQEYDNVLIRHPKAFKIYYGAGKRFYPHYNKNYDLILVDTEKQLEYTRKHFPMSKSSLWIKPAAENIFKPIDTPKIYDIIHVGNDHPNKGHIFAFSSIPKNFKVLQVGKISQQIKNKFPHIEYTDWVPRKDIAKLYGKSKISICCYEAVDSCPRIIPESLACGCPIIVLDRVNIWKEKYITPMSGMMCQINDFKNCLVKTIDEYQKFNAYDYYIKNLSLNQTTAFLKSLI